MSSNYGMLVLPVSLAINAIEPFPDCNLTTFDVRQFGSCWCPSCAISCLLWQWLILWCIRECIYMNISTLSKTMLDINCQTHFLVTWEHPCFIVFAKGITWHWRCMAVFDTKYCHLAVVLFHLVRMSIKFVFCLAQYSTIVYSRHSPYLFYVSLPFIILDSNISCPTFLISFLFLILQQLFLQFRISFLSLKWLCFLVFYMWCSIFSS